MQIIIEIETNEKGTGLMVHQSAEAKTNFEKLIVMLIKRGCAAIGEFIKERIKEIGGNPDHVKTKELNNEELQLSEFMEKCSNEVEADGNCEPSSPSGAIHNRVFKNKSGGAL